jgi:8-oxo-dGTP diphosphatase
MAFNDTFRLSMHAVILNPEKKILQLKSTYESMRWGLPGGALEPGETIHAALQRECLEELGTEVTIMYMSGLYYHKSYNSHAGIFLCELPAGKKIQLSQEHSEYRYFKLDELSQVQRQRVEDCLNFNGKVQSAAF